VLSILLIFFAIGLLLTSYLVGYLLTKNLQLPKHSISLLVTIGYGCIGFALFYSRLIFNTENYGLFLIFILTVISLLISLKKFRKNSRLINFKIVGRHDVPSLVLVGTFLSAILYCIFPLLNGEIVGKYKLIDVYDLPKHILVFSSLRLSSSWPSQSSFMEDYSLIYNVLAYEPIHLYSFFNKDSGSDITQTGLLIFFSASLLVIYLFDFFRNLKLTSFALFVSTSLITWASGLTPLITRSNPPIGFQLYAEGFTHIQNWIDDPFVSLLFVPQHVFSIILFLAAVQILTLNNKEKYSTGNYILSGFLLACSLMASFVLLPIFFVAYVFLLMTILLRDYSISHSFNLKIGVSLLPVFSLGILLPEILKLSRGTVSERFRIENFLEHLFPLFVQLPLFITILLILVYSLRVPTVLKKDLDTYLFFNVFFAFLIAFLLVPYPDGRLKSGLVLRILMVLVVALFFREFQNLEFKRKNLVGRSIALFTVFTILISFSTPIFYIQNSRTLIDPSSQRLIFFLRELPQESKILLLDGNQFLAASVDRKIDFNFFLHRSDGYMRSDERIIAGNFWNKFETNYPQFFVELQNKYDWLVVPSTSDFIQFLKSSELTPLEFEYYTLYKLVT